MDEYSKNVRRKDRQESDPRFFKKLLDESVSCSIAIERVGYPLNHVAFFVYDDKAHEIIFHFSKHGFAGEEILDGKKACISVYKYGKLYTAARAVDFGCEYQSLIIYGTIEILQREEDRLRAMDLFFQKFFSGISKESYDGFTSQDAKPIHVARVKIEDWFGKEHLVPSFALSSFYPASDPVII
ncbi:MAG TPA: pyridoxamine 5'-phosphate oxidase family protein [Chryseolinea sp.]|nr:pyridoxamine 5'-phosphate oxidase family protein [Chryseolinea sp.]